MENIFEYWYFGLLAIIIASFANLIGAGGSKFFSPLYIYVVGFPPMIAIVSALCTQTFGFGSGSISYFKQGAIQKKIVLSYLKFVIPFSILGGIAAYFIPVNLVEIIFALVLIINSIVILKYEKLLAYLETKKNNGYLFERFVLILGCFFLGFIGVGLGELITPTFLLKYKLPVKQAVGTAVFIVFISTVIAVLTHIIIMENMGNSVFQLSILKVLIFTVPGAIIGAQIGSKISSYVPRHLLKNILSIAFFILGLTIIAMKIFA